MRTIGLWRKKLPIGSESMESPPPLTINSKREKDTERIRLKRERERERSL